MGYTVVSVIIPAYNVELYIQECLDSLICQTFKNVEVIVVDDGSTDRTGYIVEEYAVSFKNLKYIRQENQGQSAARNKGVAMASGDYIVFVDSDDWLASSTALEKMVDAISRQGVDFVQGAFEFVSERFTRSNYKVDRDGIVCGNEILKMTIECDSIFTSPWAKIYDRKFIINNNLTFIEGVVNEDTAYSLMVAARANKVGFVKDVVYSSRERTGSTSRTSFKRMFKTMHDVFNITREYLKKDEKYNLTIQTAFEARYERSMLYNLLQAAQRSGFEGFMGDYEFCCRETEYLNKLNYGKWLPLLHKIMISVSRYPVLFYLLANLAKLLGKKMH